MKNLLTTTALVGALAFAAPAVAGTDVVLNGQFNFGSPTTAIGVGAIAKKVDVSVNDIDVTAVGNLNETVANGGGSTFSLTHTDTSASAGSSTKTKASTSVGNEWDVSAQVSVSNGSFDASGSVTASGSAWNNTKTKTKSSSYASSSTHSFGISVEKRNNVFVGSLQVNAGSPTTAIGVAALAKKVNLSAKTLSVQAVGNMNSTKLK